MRDVGGTSATGMSSETILFGARWRQDGESRSGRFVLRMAPDSADVPVFPSYDMERQARVIRGVKELSDVPVPTVVWVETDPSVLGAPFFVMEHVDGIVPPDVMPYNFGDNWLFDADPSDQRKLQDSSVEVLTKLHSLDLDRFDLLRFDEPGDTALAKHLAHTRAWYEFVCAGTGPSSLIDRTFTWLEGRWPEREGEPVVCWGDARIGNVLYRDFAPVAVLDWEMACVGPRELDVAWMLYAHQVFEHIVANLGGPGMPHFMRREDVVSHYEATTGRRLDDLEFFIVYSALCYGIVFLRIGQRAVHFGQREMPSDLDEFLHNRAQLEELISG